MVVHEKTGSASRAPVDWVPVERRWLGLDKRTILPGVVAMLLIAILVGGLPAIDDALKYDQQAQAGDVVNLGAGLTFVPVEGWGLVGTILTSDARVTEPRSEHLHATLVSGGVTYSVITGPFNGTPDELLDQIELLNEAYKEVDTSRLMGDRGTITTSTGLTGVGEAFAGVKRDGMLAAFVVDGIGVEVVVSGPTGSINDRETIAAVASMIDSLTYTRREGSS